MYRWGQVPDDVIKRSRILIVEDEEPVVEQLEFMLHRAGYGNVFRSANADDAYLRYHEVHPDLLLVDLHMPGSGGLDLIERVSADIPAGSYVPIMVVTGDPDPAMKLRSLAQGANDFITKPFDVYELMLRISHLLQNRYFAIELHEEPPCTCGRSEPRHP